MNRRQFINTSSHMVQEVQNIIDDYKMGALRALAQEPVQNALDARQSGKKQVEVEYRVLRRETESGEACHLLTVTDAGTTGLRGELVTEETLAARHYTLKNDENWAAFEAQGYTKENEDALGSRGQGKAAFLFHSHVPGVTRRMLMLYDTLLKDEEYRFGMRFARPVDQVLNPPLFYDEARAAIEGASYRLEDDLAVPLGLKPLRHVGTRVIVPFLAKEMVDDLRPGGELASWLQRCWWRAIQLGKLRIRIVDDDSGNVEHVTVPDWWQNLPRQRGKPSVKGTWYNLPDGGRACIWGNLKVKEDHAIRRLVMLYSDSLSEDEITTEPEFAGIQLLRGSQWIETQGVRQEYGDYVPIDKRPGFRGFVEFDGQTDAELRIAEHSTHDSFKGQRKIVRQIRAALEDKVQEFCGEMGWESQQPVSVQQVSQREQQTHARFLETFLSPNGRQKRVSNVPGEDEPSPLRWDCHLDLDYPNPQSARVDWGQKIRNVCVEVEFEPANELNGDADLLLEWVDDTGKSHELERKEGAIRAEWRDHSAKQQFQFGNWQIVRGKANQNRQISCPDDGVGTLRATVIYQGMKVKSAVRMIYVQTEPPPPPERKPVTLDLSAVNENDNSSKRINHGEAVVVNIIARNRDVQSGHYFLTASLCDEIMARELPFELTATPAGDRPRPQSLLDETIQLLDPRQRAPRKARGIRQLQMPESSGTYRVHAELRDQNGKLVAYAGKNVYFQTDPPNKRRNDLPFKITPDHSGTQKEMWKMNADLSELTYPDSYPLRKELRDVQRQRRPLQGKNAFIAEISAHGLLEWALRPMEDGDESNFQRLLDEHGDHTEPLRERYVRKLEQLSRDALESPTEFGRIRRETVAAMLEIFDTVNA